MTTKTLPQGIRQNNPLNLVHSAKNKWQGLAEPPAIGRFCNFQTMAHGIRAAALNLIAYQDRHGFNTIKGLIGRWAPHSENNVEAYVFSVCQRTGFQADQPLDLHTSEHLRPLVKAMARHENGGDFFGDDVLDKGLTMAGVVPPQRPLAATRTVKGGQVAAGGTAGTAALTGMAEVIDQAKDGLSGVMYFVDSLKWVFIGLTLLGVGIMLYARWQDHKRALR